MPYVVEVQPYPLTSVFCVSACAVRWERSQGRIVRQKNRAMAPEEVRDQWEQICDFTDATKPSTVQGQDALGVDRSSPSTHTRERSVKVGQEEGKHSLV